MTPAFNSIAELLTFLLDSQNYTETTFAVTPAAYAGFVEDEGVDPVVLRCRNGDVTIVLGGPADWPADVVVSKVPDDN